MKKILLKIGMIVIILVGILGIVWPKPHPRPEKSPIKIFRVGTVDPTTQVKVSEEEMEEISRTYLFSKDDVDMTLAIKVEHQEDDSFPLFALSSKEQYIFIDLNAQELDQWTKTLIKVNKFVQEYEQEAKKKRRKK